MSADIFEENIIRAVRKLVSAKPPLNKRYIDKLLGFVKTHDEIPFSLIIEYLACSGYSIRDIFILLIEAGIMPRDKIDEMRGSIRRILLSPRYCEELIRDEGLRWKVLGIEQEKR